MSTVFIIILVLLLFGGLPNWGIHHYGYAPSGIVFFIIILLVILIVAGRL